MSETRAVADERLANREWLYERYVREGRSMCDIAEECACTPTTVSRWLSRHGIEKRTPPQDRKYSREDLLSWIEAFTREFGVVPSSEAARDWPGPALETYVMYFGSWSAAVRAAGYSPRSERGDDDG